MAPTNFSAKLVGTFCRVKRAQLFQKFDGNGYERGKRAQTFTYIVGKYCQAVPTLGATFIVCRIVC